MSELRLFDTLSRRIKPLSPADRERFRFYCCGPTVYGPGHIGNFRTFLVNDILYRTAQLAGLNPYYVRNITDVDDKTIRDSQAAGEDLRSFTDYWMENFHRDCKRLNMLPPDREPRATDHIDEQIELIKILMKKGHAYQANDGSVYYRIDSFPGYGKLSHFAPENLRTQNTNSAGTQNLADEYEREQIADFALWKAHKESDGRNAWESPWGKGRPGWHLECSAMSMKYLGESFDLHTGGEDLCFPHHENEIAQSEAATGKPFARHWMHTVFLLVDGKKMSKSLGNFHTVEDLVEKGYDPATIRHVLISGHYRKQLNFTLHSLDAARSALEKLTHTVGEWVPELVNNPNFSIFEEAWNHLLDDLNIPAALGSLFGRLKDYDSTNAQHREGLNAILYAMGINTREQAGDEVTVPDDVRELAEKRWKAKQEKDFATADRLREEIQSQGWAVLDKKDGYEIKSD